MNKQFLAEYQDPSLVKNLFEDEETFPGSGIKTKNLYLSGIFIQGDIRNANQRIYPTAEINKAVNSLAEMINNKMSILGELDHPADLKINMDRISHVITEIHMAGANGVGRMKVLSTPMGNIIKTLVEAGCQIGVSSRGSGNVNESTGYVSEFEIITIDAVAQPSAPNAYPKAIYEGLFNFNGGARMFDVARFAHEDVSAQKYLSTQICGYIRDMRLK